ncbi:MAG: hypothetical protein P3B76_11810 [Gemmatimonadota bacterium]|nr:hypothetical protein [Gemmatimonadota bacterium]
MSTLSRALQAVLVSAALTTLSAAQAFGQAKLDTVLVTGRGATLWEARQDAVRQALQQTRKQLVIADRAVSGDSLVRDEVLSTLNGFIEGFDVISQTSPTSDTDWTVKARVVVSPSAMTQYIAPKNGGESSANVKGDLIVADIAAVRARREVNRKLYERLLDGFPWQAYDLSIEKVTPDAEAESVTVSVVAKMNDAFRKQLQSSMTALLAAGSAEMIRGRRDFEDMVSSNFEKGDDRNSSSSLSILLNSPKPEQWVGYDDTLEFWGIRLSPVKPHQFPLEPPTALAQTHMLAGDFKAIDLGQGVWWSTFSAGLPVVIETRSHMIFAHFGGPFLTGGTYIETEALREDFNLPATVFEGTSKIAVRPTDFFDAMISKRTVILPDCTRLSKAALEKEHGPIGSMPTCISEITTPTGTWIFDQQLMLTNSSTEPAIPFLGQRNFLFFKRKTAEQREQ